MLRLRMDKPLLKDGKQKAVTLSFDDGVTQDIKFIELLDKYKVKCTFNLNSGTLGQKDWLIQLGLDVSHYKVEKEQVAQIYKNHEVAIHTLTHPSLPDLPMGSVAYEVTADRKNLEEILKKPIRGMAYPFGTYSDEVVSTLRTLGVEYARTVDNIYDFQLPHDFLLWHPTCSYKDEKLKELTKKFLINRTIEEYKKPQVFYVWGHSYEFEGRNHWELIEEFLKDISGHEDIWYATNIEIVDYMNAFKQLKYSVTGDYIYNPTLQDLWVSIDETVYKLPSGETTQIKNPNE